MGRIPLIILQTAGIQKAFGTNVILEDITLTLQDHERIGLVGVNGSGKSTLLRIIAGESSADAGQIHTQKGLRIGYHAQLDVLTSTLSVWEEMIKVFEPVFAMERRLRDMEQQMGTLHEEDPAAYDKLVADYDRLTGQYEEAGGYSWQSQVRGVLTGLGIAAEQYDQAVDSLSGGERTRLKLAQLLLRGADVLLLDEPTNHLDLAATAWLENYLQSFPGSVIVVSHDRYFMDAVCTGIAELTMRKLTQYEGNYSVYLDKRAASYEQRMKQYELQQKYIEREQAIIARYRRFNREKSIRAARSREKRLEKIDLVERPTDEQGVYFSFQAGRATGQEVLIAEGLTKSFGDRVLFNGIDLHLRAGDRMAIIGPNGAGKTTFLRILLGLEEPDSGTVKFGAGVEPGYYDQQQRDLDPKKDVLDEVWDEFPRMEQTQIRNALAGFLLTGDDVFQPIHTLSGGERGRVLLTKLMLRKNNFLILDEPTNHLDMDSREMLEQALYDFDGTLLAVSHDRFFINRIFTRLLVLSDGGTVEYLGNYDDYQERLKAQNLPQEETQTRTKTALREEKRREREAIEAARQEKERLRNLETLIESLEEEMTRLEVEMSDPDNYKDPEKSRKMAADYARKKEKLEGLYAQWEQSM